MTKKEDQTIYWTPEWLARVEETKKALAEGQGLTFPDAEGVIHWLQEEIEWTLT